MSDTDFAALIEPVARHFWGDPNPKLSSKTCLRWGGQGSRSVELNGGGFWKDFETGEGGGVIKLVKHERQCSDGEAIEWLEGQDFIAKRDSGRSAAPQRLEQPRTTDEPPEQEALPVDTPQGVQTPVKGYRYTDADGNPLYEVIRYHFKLPDGSWQIDEKTGNPKKTFRQRRPDGKGGFIYNLDGIGHTIYRHQAVELAIAEGKTIGLQEGEKDVETLEEWGLVATTNSGGVTNWTSQHADLFVGADVVIFVDNDDAGRAGVEKRAMSLRGKAKRIRMLDIAAHVPGFPAKLDVTDWRDRMGGTAEKLQAIIDALPDWRPRPPVSKFGAIGLDRLHEPHLKHDFLIDGFLDRRGVAMMPGASGSGKTFLVLELGMCVAINQPFWGMKVKPGLVMYQAGEGKEGVTKRLDGWLLDRGVEPSADVPFKMLPKKVNLFVDDKDTDDLIAESQAWAEYYDQPVRLVVIDTFNKAITGANENAGQDMGKVLSRLERISEALDCAVLVPMHKSKQGDMRGHTSLMGDASNVINVSKLEIRDGNGRQIRTAALDKNKDGEGGHPMRFVLRQVVTGVEDDGRPRTTCVVDRPNGDDEALVAEGKLSLNQTLFLQTLRDAIGIEGEEPPAGVTGVPHGKQVVKYRAFEARLWNKWPFTAPEHEIEKRKKEFERAVGDAGKRLVTYGYVERDNDTKLIWWTGKSDRPPRKVQQPPPAGAGIAPDVKQEIAAMGDVPF